MRAIILHKYLGLIRNNFRDLCLSMTKSQPSVSFKSVSYKRKSVYLSIKISIKIKVRRSLISAEFIHWVFVTKNYLLHAFL